MKHLPACLSAMVLALAACSSPGGEGPDVPAPTGLQLVSRFPDQVCADARRPALATADNFVDTVGLGEAVRAAGVGPREDPGAVDFVVWYGTDGVPDAAGLWSTTMDANETLAIQGVFADRVLDTGVLAEPTSIRTVVEIGDQVLLRSDRSVECLPHVRHPQPLGRPFGLPDSVVMTGGTRRVARGARAAVIRIHVDETGRLTAVDSVAGTSELVSEARRIMHLLSYDPALLDGRPVPGEMIFRVDFRRAR